VVHDRLKIAVGEAAGLCGESEGSLDLVRPDRRILVRIRSTPEAAARMSQRSAPGPRPRKAASSGLAALGLGWSGSLVRSG
jgi:hypothetical protein